MKTLASQADILHVGPLVVGHFSPYIKSKYYCHIHTSVYDLRQFNPFQSFKS